MQTLEVIAKRKSTRAYKPEKISEAALTEILNAGCAAPVAMGNYKSLHITVVESQELLDRINAAATEMLKKAGIHKNADYGAKTLVLVSSTPVHRPGTDHANAGIVVENMVLAATDMGIDSVILGAAPAAIAQNEELIKALQIPDGYTPVLGVFFGYGAEETESKTHSITINRV